MLTERVVCGLLRDARALIAAGWTSGAYVRSESGWAVPIDSKSVARVCVAGALDRVGLVNGLDMAERDQLRAALVAFLPAAYRDDRDGFNLEAWNDKDNRTPAHVLELYDLAIAALEVAA